MAEDGQDFLRKREFSKAVTGWTVDKALAKERRLPESVFAFLKGITAVARSKPRQDASLVMERKARDLMRAAV